MLYFIFCMDKDKYYTKTMCGNWVHRPPVKILLNPILRKLQFWRNDPYVIASHTNFIDGQPKFIKYLFCRVEYNK